MNWLLIMTIILFVVFGFAGLRRGILRMILSLLTVVICIIATATLAPKVKTFVEEKTNWEQKLEETINKRLISSEKVNAEVDEVIADDNLENIDADNPQMQSYLDQIMSQLSDAGIVIPGVDSVTDRATNLINDTGTKIKDGICIAIAESIASFIINIIINVVIFVIVLILMKVIIRATDVVTKLPVIHQANAFLGLIAGLAEALIIVWFILAVFFAGMQSGLTVASMPLIDNNWIMKFLYDNDPIIKMISK